jgi:integrase
LKGIAHNVKNIGIHLAGVRQKLTPQNEPYWRYIARGQTLGYRKSDTTKTCSWIARLKKKGKRTYHALGHETETFDYDQAEAAAKEWFEEQKQGASSTTQGAGSADSTVADACRAYVTNMDEARKKPSTAHDAKKSFERVVYDRVNPNGGKPIANPFGRIRLKDLENHHVQTWVGTLQGAPATVARTVTRLKAALNLAVSQKMGGITLAKSQEWAKLQLPENPNNRRELFLDLKQRQALLGACKGGLRDLIEGAMVTGARAGELTSALCNQFDARSKLMTFTGKTGRRKGVPLSTPALKLFKRLAKGKQPDDHLFTRDDGKPWAHSDWDELVRDAATKAELPAGVCLYTMRHSFIRQAISGGMTTLDVARLTGTSLQMIEEHYGDMIPKEARARLSKVKFI